METVNAIAGWYGAVIGTAGLILSYWLARQDRPILVCRIEMDRRIINSAQYDENTIYTVFSLSNRGRRPITISTVSVCDAGKTVVGSLHDALLAAGFELAEGKCRDLLIEQSKRDRNVFSYLLVTDVTGQFWVAPIRINRDLYLKRRDRTKWFKSATV